MFQILSNKQHQYSPVCIEKMREANIDRVGMECT